MTTRRHRTTTTRCLTGLLVLLLASPATGRDLDAVSDGQHLWMVEEGPSNEKGVQLQIYHHPAGITEGDRGRTAKLDPLPGELMPRGLAAGDGKLLIVTADRAVRTVRPVWSPLLREWVYEKRALPSLPGGCTLVSITLGPRGPWALVRVEDADLLKELDGQASTRQPIDRRLLNRALGLPDSYGLPPEDEPTDPPAEDAIDPDAETPAGGSAEGQPEPAAGPKVPAYRLIHHVRGRWVSSPLPDGFVRPKHVVLMIREGDQRPTLLIDTDDPAAATPGLRRYAPVEPLEAEPAADADGPPGAAAAAWAEMPIAPQPLPGKAWSAVEVKGQAVLAIERWRSYDTLTIEAYLLRGERAASIGELDLRVRSDTRWAVLPWRDAIGLVGRPGPWIEATENGSPRPLPLAALTALTLDGEVLDAAAGGGLVALNEAERSQFEGNADLMIQIAAFIAAMLTMMLFYRRAPRADQLELPDGLMLATFGRRMIAGLIDLAPGFLIAGAMYDISVSETVLYWPGNGVAKALPAMRPGFVVIVVTLAHTTLFEFVTARSIGKWLTGLYVAELSGRPAPAGPCAVRAFSRVFDLFAPLMLVLAVISPARQRLGDILARTIVVMPLPEEPPEDEQQDDGFD